MLTDIALKNLKPKAALYKVTDGDGMYVTVSPVGTVAFGPLRLEVRLDFRTVHRLRKVAIETACEQATLPPMCDSLTAG